MVGGRKELSQRLFSEPKRAETRKVRFLVNILMSNIKFPKFPGKVDWALYCAPVKIMENFTLISHVCSSKWPLSYAAGLRKSCGPPCPLLRQSHFDCAIHLLRFIRLSPFEQSDGYSLFFFIKRKTFLDQKNSHNYGIWKIN